jgi:hypothetical protein
MKSLGYENGGGNGEGSTTIWIVSGVRVRGRYLESLVSVREVVQEPHTVPVLRGHLSEPTICSHLEKEGQAGMYTIRYTLHTSSKPNHTTTTQGTAPESFPRTTLFSPSQRLTDQKALPTLRKNSAPITNISATRTRIHHPDSNSNHSKRYKVDQLGLTTPTLNGERRPKTTRMNVNYQRRRHYVCNNISLCQRLAAIYHCQGMNQNDRGQRPSLLFIDVKYCALEKNNPSILPKRKNRLLA